MRPTWIHVLVNYETTWYRSNHAAFAIAHDGSIGEIRKVVVHDGHRGPKEIGVSPAFFAWLTDPVKNGAGDSLAYLKAVVVDGLKPEALSSLETNIVVTEILDAARRSAGSGQAISMAAAR